MYRCPLRAFLWSWLLFRICSSQQTTKNEYNRYVTEPTFRSNLITIINSTLNKSELQPGHIFFSPFPTPGEAEIGPQIVDQDGELIWYGNATTNARVQNFNVCNYREEKPSHLCWSEGWWNDLRDVDGANRIFDNTYTQAGRDYVSTQPLQNPNPHEFNFVSNGNSFLQAVFQRRRMDLTTYGGFQDGYVYDGCFQEVDIQSGQAIFSWCGLDHLELWHTYVYFEKATNDTGEHFGTGAIDSPWDYFHINAVDKNDEGDYFVSARHLDQILKIAGYNNAHGVAPGSILWKLGGRLNEFSGSALLDINRQHHIRHHKTTANETTISLFNNQWLQNDGKHGISNAQLIVLNNETMRVTDFQKHYNPDGLLSVAQGSTQILPNKNVFVGWGTVPQITEFSPNGTLLYHAHLANCSQKPHTQQNYRAFKFDWVGNPKWLPKLVAYSRRCGSKSDSPLTAYVSWNGATKVRFWRFYSSSISKRGPWFSAGTFQRTGFETKVYLKTMFGRPAGFSRYVTVEALDEQYSVLSSATVETLVPDETKSVQHCGADGCFESGIFEYDTHISGAGACRADIDAFIPVVALVLVCCILEYLIYKLLKSLVLLFMRSKRGPVLYSQVQDKDVDMEKENSGDTQYRSSILE